MKLKSLVAALLFCAVSTAQAGFLIDPYVGTGKYATTFNTTGFTDESDLSVTTVGSRLGYSFLLFSAGVDYQMDTIDKGNRTNISAFVGVDMPILVRAYAKYIVNSNFTNDDLDNLNVDVAFKNGYAIGLGFTGLPFVVINLEIEKSSYTMENFPAVGDVDFDYAQTLLTVSLPLDF